MVGNDSHGPEVPLEPLPIDVLCENIGRVILASDLCQGKFSSAQPLLDPEVGGMQMPDFSQATAPAHAYRRRGVSAHLEAELYAEVPCNALEAQAMARPTAYA